eukprot:3147870-Pyramimonas_sp.AAC.1
MLRACCIERCRSRTWGCDCLRGPGRLDWCLKLHAAACYACGAGCGDVYMAGWRFSHPASESVS